MARTVFIDDSGSKEYVTPHAKEFVDNPPPYKGNEAFWRGNYFVLCGVSIDNADLKDLNDQFNALKKKYFGTYDVEVKSVWMRIPDKRKKYYLDPYGITPEQLNQFGEEYFDLIAKNADRMKLFATVFDKRYYGPSRNKPEGTPLLKAAQVLLERIHSYCGGGCSVVFDQMESSLSITRGAHNKLQGVYLKNEGMANIYVPSYGNIDDVTFKKSSSENFLQVADVCAYTIARQFIEHGGEWNGSNKNPAGDVVLRTYDYFKRIRCNFYVGGIFRSKVRGYGLVCIPDIAKINWDFQKGCTV
ncbi:DUF3800 domain-containing protein [Patescibacteria group bacterium]|nr:DUF3800 domain-containing protein [Patescibacteria group bacterium]